MPFNIFGDWMNAPLGSFAGSGVPVTQPLPYAQPLSYSQSAQSGPSAGQSTPATIPPQATPVPLPLPRLPLPLAPPNAMPMPVPAAAPSPASPVGGLGGFVGGLGSAFGNSINNHPLTLMALGAGIAQGGVGRGLAAATSAAETERNLQLQQLNYLHTYNALTSAGVPPQQAQAAIGNPSVMRAVAVRYLGSRAQGNTPPAGAAPMRPPVPARSAVPAPGPAAAAPSMVPAASAAASVSPGRAPALPPNVPSDAQFSPYRNQWRDLDGKRYDPSGRAVG